MYEPLPVVPWIEPNDPQGLAQVAELVTLAVSRSDVWSLLTEMLSVIGDPPATALTGLVFVMVTTAALLAKFTIVVPAVDPARLDETVIV